MVDGVLRVFSCGVGCFQEIRILKFFFYQTEKALLRREMNQINKFQTLIIAVAVILGLLLGQVSFLADHAQFFIVPFLMLMLFGLFLNIPMKDILKSFNNQKFFAANLVVNFIWTPVFAYLLGNLLLQNQLSLWIGFVMLLVTPCTDWYLIFIGMAKGNVPLGASVLPVNLLLQILLLPIYLFLFFGKSTTVDLGNIMEGIFLVLVIPLVLAQLLKSLSTRKYSDWMTNRVLPFFDSSQVIFLGCAIIAMFASQGNHLTANPEAFLLLLLPLMLFFIGNFFVGRFASYYLKFRYADSASFSLTTLARNSPISLAIAITAFPNEPLIALALIVGPLIELPILFLASQVLRRIKNSEAGRY